MSGLTDLFDILPIGVAVVDADARVHEWNTWLAQKTGIYEEIALGKTLGELFPAFRSPRLLWAIEQCIQRQAPQVLSQALNHMVFPIPVEFQQYGVTLMQQQTFVAPMIAPDGTVLALISIIDVTESVAKSSALSEMAQRLERQSNRDELTGAFNRRFLWDWMSQQLKLCVRQGTPLACLMLDIDHFKRINDTYGHDAGDKVLKSFAGLVRNELRDSDILVRYGGEEFVVLLPNTPPDAALMVANRILAAVRAATVEPLEQGGLTSSIGLSVWTVQTPCTGEELLKQADRLLYQAKEAGRDRVVAREESSVHPAGR